MPIPIPIWAYDAVESDSSETDNIKTPKISNRTERFICNTFLLAQSSCPITGNPGLITFRLIKPGNCWLVAGVGRYFGFNGVATTASALQASLKWTKLKEDLGEAAFTRCVR